MTRNSSKDALSPEQWTARRHFLLGLGGSGALCTKFALQFMKRRTGGQRPANCEALVLDAATEEAEIDADIEHGDYVNVAGFNANRYFRDAAKFSWLNWLAPSDFLPGELSTGAAGRPHIGRLCYFISREGKIRHAVERKLRNLTRHGVGGRLRTQPGFEHVRLEPRDVVVYHIFASVCGGMGAGLLLDCAWDVRMWCELLTGHRPVVVGHLLLPGAFGLELPSGVRRQQYANAYCILSQINHFAGSHAADISYKETVTYGTAPVQWDSAGVHFDYIYLIDGPSDTSTTDRISACRNIGRMAAMMATEPAGNTLALRAVNIQPHLFEDRANDTELPIFSSYELAAGVRPENQLDEEFDRRVFECLANILGGETETDPDTASWLDGIRRDFFDDAEFIRELYEEPNERVTSSIQQGTRAEGDRKQKAGQESKEYIRDFMPQLRDKAKQRYSHAAGAWIDENLDTAVSSLLRDWCRRADTSHGVFLGFIKSTRAALQAHVEPLRAAEPADKLEEKLKTLTTSWEKTLMDADSILATMRDYAKAIAQRERNLAFQWLLDSLSERFKTLERRTLDIAETCRKYLDGTSAAAGKSDAGVYHYLYQIDWDAMAGGDVSKRLNELAKGMAIDILLEPKTLYARDIKRRVDESEVAAEQRQKVRELLIEMHEGNDTEDVNRLREGIQHLCDMAEPRWLIQPHEEVQSIDLVLMPESMKGRSLGRDANSTELTEISDRDYNEVTVVRTQHGAALKHLLNFEPLYKDAFESLLNRRKEMARKRGLEYDECQMWLDKNWVIEKPVTGSTAPGFSELATRSFGMFWGSWWETTPDGVIVYDAPEPGRRRQRRRLKLKIVEAFEQWSSPENEQLVEELWTKFKSSVDPSQIFPLGIQCRDDWRKVRDETASDKERGICEIIRSSLAEACDTEWKNLRQREQFAPEAPEPSEPKASATTADDEASDIDRDSEDGDTRT